MTCSPVLRFIQLLPSVPASGAFLLKDLPGSGKRIDVLCRDLAACFQWGPHLWPSTQLEFVAYLDKRIALTVTAPEGAPPKGEVPWAEILKDSLNDAPPSFIAVEEVNLAELIGRFNSNSNCYLWVLHEHGLNISECEFTLSESQNSFMLGDHRGFDSQTEDMIEQHGLRRVSLGSTSYLSSHCVAAIISVFERLL